MARIGATFPQTVFGDDPIAVRDFAQAAEDLGYSHVLAYDHVLGARREGFGFTDAHPFHEPLVLFGFLAAITSRIELVTGVVILPQRQTVLVAKQAAEVQILSGGRLRLGVGIGWNQVEYEALNEEFGNRGARCAEQLELLRKLWSEPLLDYSGRWHRVDRASICPRPSARIPIWLGGGSDGAFRRAAEHADGFVFAGDRERSLEGIGRLRSRLEEAGRDPATFGLEVFVEYGSGPDGWAEEIEACRREGITHVSMRTISGATPAPDPQDHIDALAVFADVVGLSASGGADEAS
jgi:probable F420-dependent oxidoreductase